MTLRCIHCGRYLREAAAWKPGIAGCPPGPVGPTCARTLGLIERTLFSQRRVVTVSRRRKAKPDGGQMALELA